MRRLVLLRHAKSSWDDPGLEDFDRPLAPRGEAAVPVTAGWLADRGLVPDLVLCSPAARAVETWERAAPFLAVDRVKFETGLYAATAERLLERLGRIVCDPATALLLGHNPALEALAARLAGDGEAKAAKRMAKKFPTAAVAVLRLDIDAWAEVADGCGYLEAFETPKRLQKKG